MAEEAVEVRKTEPTKQTGKSSPLSSGLISAVLALGVLLSAGAAIYFWQDSRDARNQTPEAIAERNQEESARVIESLKSVLQINNEDEPTVARIEDAQVLREANPDFYADAQINDYLVLYPQRAIIYREAENKIVNIAPIINTADLQPQPAGQGDGETAGEQTTN